MKAQPRLLLVPAAALALLAGISACNNSTFAGASPRTAQALTPTPTPTPKLSASPSPTPGVVASTPTPVPGVQQLTLTCAQLASTTTNLTVAQNGSTPPQVQVTGQMCPNVTNQLTVLFIVDWSGSMADSDPKANGSCGRSQAAAAILNYIQAQNPTNVAINVAEIPFDTDVETDGIIQPTPLASFLPQIGVNSFCQAVGSTDYVSAFQAAQQMLAGVSGRKVIYFISDGVPNVTATGSTPNDGGTKAAADSITAGQALAQGVTNLTMNSLLLGSQGPQAQSILTQIAGDASRVQVVADASQLATQILTFPALTLQLASASASLTAPNSTAQPVSLSSFQPDPTTTNVWDFITAPLTLEGPSGATTTNTVTVTVKGSDGSQQQAVVNIHYTAN